MKITRCKICLLFLLGVMGIFCWSWNSHRSVMGLVSKSANNGRLPTVATVAEQISRASGGKSVEASAENSTPQTPTGLSTAAVSPVSLPPAGVQTRGKADAHPKAVVNVPLDVTVSRYYLDELAKKPNLADPVVRRDLARRMLAVSTGRRRLAWERARQSGLPTEVRQKDGGVMRLQDFENDRPIYYTTENASAALHTVTTPAIDQLEASAATTGAGAGQGMTIGMWDGGILLDTHQEFQTSGGFRVTYMPDQGSAVSSHSTHVAGTLVAGGVDPLARGMAPRAFLYVWDYDDDLAEMEPAVSVTGNDGLLLVSNHSYGDPAGWHYDSTRAIWLWLGAAITPGDFLHTEKDRSFGQYGHKAASMDALEYTHPYHLQVRAAGNDADDVPADGANWRRVQDNSFTYQYNPFHPKGDDSYKLGFDTIRTNCLGKNVLSVGSVGSAYAAASPSVRVPGLAKRSKFSSTGPTDDGRIKPDVMGLGEDVYSAGISANNDYARQSGTSMASPNVAGSALLLQQVFARHSQPAAYMRASTLKGLIIHTADDLNSPGPDYLTGWGLMNTQAAVTIIEAATEIESGRAALMIEDQILQGAAPEVFTVFAQGTDESGTVVPLRVTLCWTDPPGSPTADHDERVPDLVNDLDLEVENVTEGITYPFAMPYPINGFVENDLGALAIRAPNTVDNVEQVLVETPTRGNYTIRVKTPATLTDAKQHFSLIITGAGDPPKIQLTSDGGSDVMVSGSSVWNVGSTSAGGTVSRSVTVTNMGGVPLQVTGLVLAEPHPDFIVNGFTPGKLVSGGKTSFNIAFIPQAGAATTRMSSFVVQSNDPDTPSFSVALTGDVIPDAEAKLLWRKPVELTAAFWSSSPLLAVDPAGNPVLAAFNQLHKLAGSDARLLWTRKEQKLAMRVLAENGLYYYNTYDDITNDAFLLDPAGDVLLTGVGFANGPPALYQTPPARGKEYRVVKLSNAAGAITWETLRSNPSALHHHAASQIPGDVSFDTYVRADSHGNWIARASDGSIITAGHYGPTPILDENGSVVSGERRYAVFKQSGTTGASLWEQMGLLEAAGLALDASDNVIVTGQLWPVSPDPGSQVGPYQMPTGWVTVKRSSETGAVLWQQQLNWTPNPYSSPTNNTGCVATDHTGNVLVLAPDRLVKHAAATGQILWQKVLTQEDPALGFRRRQQVMAVDAEGSIFLAGHIFEGGGNSPTSATFVMQKYDASGNLVWEDRQAAGDDVRLSSYGWDALIALDLDGNPIVARAKQVEWYITPDSFPRLHVQRSAAIISKYISRNGTLLWQHMDNTLPDGFQMSPVWDLVPDRLGNVYLTSRGGNHVLVTKYAIPVRKPVIHTDLATVTVDEGDTATNIGEFASAVDDQSVIVTASVGSLTRHVLTYTSGGASFDRSEWRWSHPVTDGPVQNGVITITAREGANTSQVTFNLEVLNVAPDFDPGGNQQISAAGGATFNRGPIPFTDPGADVWSGTADYGDGSGSQPLVINQTAKTFKLSHAYAAAGNYTVLVTLQDDDGGSQTKTLQVSISSAPVTTPVHIDLPPASQLVAAGQPVKLMVVASGGAPITCQWRKNNVNIPGATSTEYTIAAAQVGHAGAYSAILTNAVSSVPSGVAELGVVEVTNAVLSPTLFKPAPVKVNAAGNGLTFDWSYINLQGDQVVGGSEITGWGTKALTIKSFQSPFAGLYSCKITGPGGQLTSGTTQLLLGSGQPNISVEQPPGTDLIDGASMVDFGSAPVDNSLTRTFTVFNKGGTILVGLAISIDGANASDFSLVSPLATAPITGPKGSTTFTIRFAPSGTGSRSAALHLISNDPDESPFDIALIGTATPAAGALSIGDGGTIPANEIDGKVDIPIVRTGGSFGAVTVKLTTANGTAVAPGDFTALNGVIASFANGQTSTTVPVTIVNSSTGEANETFTVKLSEPTGAAHLGSQPTGIVTITDASSLSNTADTSPPSAPTITAPAAGAFVGLGTDAPTIVSGKATDNKGVQKVEVSLNGGPFDIAILAAPGAASTAFSLSITPATGTNAIQVKSTDLVGRVSSVATRTFIVTRPLAVSIAGSGAVTAGFAPTSFREVGKTYTITATPVSTPAPGFVFNGWSTNGTAGTGITTAKAELPTLSFTMREGLTLAASFIANPFAAEAGSYNGLVKSSPVFPDRAPLGINAANEDGTKPGVATEGFFNAAVQSNGTFTGNLTLDGQVHILTGAFDNSGVARFNPDRARTTSLVRASKPSLLVALQLDLTAPGGADQITGTVTQGNHSSITDVSDIMADRAYYNGTTISVNTGYLTTTSNGTYTAIFKARGTSQQPAGLTASDYPQGTGFAKVSITKAGVVSFNGTLADNTPLTSSAPLSKSNTCPLFVRLYNKLGFVSALITLDKTAPDSDFSAPAMSWSRPYQNLQHYPFGWTEVITTDLVGAKYAAATGQSVLPNLLAPARLADLDFTQGLLTAPVSKDVSISTTDIVTRIPATGTDYTLTTTRSTGVFSGSFTHSDGTKPTYQGIIYQKGAHAGGHGFFLTTTPAVMNHLGESGKVNLSAQ